MKLKYLLDTRAFWKIYVIIDISFMESKEGDDINFYIIF